MAFTGKLVQVFFVYRFNYYRWRSNSNPRARSVNWGLWRTCSGEELWCVGMFQDGTWVLLWSKSSINHPKLLQSAGMDFSSLLFYVLFIALCKFLKDMNPNLMTKIFLGGIRNHDVKSDCMLQSLWHQLRASPQKGFLQDRINRFDQMLKWGDSANASFWIGGNDCQRNGKIVYQSSKGPLRTFLHSKKVERIRSSE